jgi:hypothetical protein
MRPWLLITRAVMTVVVAWQFLVVVRRLRKRSSFVKISRRWHNLTQVDFVLHNFDGTPTAQGVVSLHLKQRGIEPHMRPGALEELAELDRTFVPDGDPNGHWPSFVQPPVAEADIVSAANTVAGAEPLRFEDLFDDGDDKPLAQAS